MSQLSTNTYDLQALLARALDLPKAPKVCTAVVSGYTATYKPSKLFYTIMNADKELSPEQIEGNTEDSVILDNIICGSILVVEWSNYGKDTLSGLELLGAYNNVAIFKVIANAGETATAIRYYEILS